MNSKQKKLKSSDTVYAFESRPCDAAANSKTTLGSSYAQGWFQTDKKRGERYLQILNDLAEGMDNRVTKAELAEVLGWLQREQMLMNDHMNEIHGELLLLSSKSLTSSMKKGLFKAAHSPKS